MKFSTNVCPLCDKVLKFHKTHGVNAFECPAQHYQVELDAENSIQHIFIDDLCLDNYSNHSRSRIWKLNEDNKWKMLLEVAPIHAASEEVIRARLSKIVSML